MLSQEFVLMILEASLTGGGLVFALYALVAPILSKLFNWRVEAATELEKELRETLPTLEKEMREIREKVNASDAKIAHETTKRLEKVYSEVGRLETKSVEMVEKMEYPSYLSWWFFFTFFGYIISTILCVYWLVNESLLITQTAPSALYLADGLIAPIFVLTTVSFFLLGLFSIRNMHSVTRKEFEDIKKRIKPKEPEHMHFEPMKSDEKTN